VRGDARHRSRRREPPPWFVCAAETDEEKSFAALWHLARTQLFFRVFPVFVPLPLLEVQTVLPATSERCRWSTHVALARARAQKQPVHSRKSFQMSERKAVIKNADMSEVRVRRVTRYRAVSVASAAETECLCGLSSLPPGKSNTFRRPPRARPSIDRGTRDSPLSSRPTAASRITGPPAGCRGLRHPGASPRRLSSSAFGINQRAHRACFFDRRGARDREPRDRPRPIATSTPRARVTR
jgi:hypothetical protein